MVRTRQAKVDRIAETIPPMEVDDPSAEGGQGAKVLVLGWGSTYGPIARACAACARPASTSPRRTCAT